MNNRIDQTSANFAATDYVDSQMLRSAMGNFATGVTVVTVRGKDGPHGMTANAVTSVSLEPPLILICINRTARLRQYLADGQHFAVNILGEGQECLSRYFSRAWPASVHPPAYRFEYFDRCPTLADSMTSLVCRVTERYAGGDHDIVLGKARAIHGNTSSNPLLFFQGRYARLFQPTMRA